MKRMLVIRAARDLAPSGPADPAGPGQSAQILMVPDQNSLATLQEAVGDNIEAAYSAEEAFPVAIELFANEEGLIKGLPYNEAATDLCRHDIVGDVVLFGGADDDGNELALDDSQMELLTGWLKDRGIVIAPAKA